MQGRPTEISENPITTAATIGFIADLLQQDWFFGDIVDVAKRRRKGDSADSRHIATGRRCSALLAFVSIVAFRSLRPI
jgi:hypothetical protein